MKINAINVTYCDLMISILSLRSTGQRAKNLVDSGPMVNIMINVKSVFRQDVEKYI